jgi:hypothetical protein
MKFPTESVIKIMLKDFATRTDEQLMAQLPAIIQTLTDLAEIDRVQHATSRKKLWPTKPSTQEKLYYRWNAVSAAKQRLNTTWKAAYQNASGILKRTPYAGSPRTMKESYQLHQHIRRKRATSSPHRRRMLLPNVDIVFKDE